MAKRVFYLKKVGKDWLHTATTPPKPYSVFPSEKSMNEFLARNKMVRASAIDNLKNAYANSSEVSH